MKAEEIKDLIVRFHEEVWNKGNVSLIEEVFASNYAGYDDVSSGLTDREQMKQTVLQYRAAAPDLHLQVNEILVEGDRVAFRWQGSGTTEQGKVENVGITIWRFVDDQVVEDHFVAAPVTVGQPAA